MFGREPERGAARRQHPQPWRRGEQVADDRRRIEQLLEVVQDEQQPPLSEALAHVLGERPLAVSHVERLGDRGNEQLRARDGREADEEGPVPQLGLERLRDREPEACLPGSSGARERDEPRPFVAEQRTDGGQLEPAADERRGRDRQRPCRARRSLRSGEPRVLLQDRALQFLQGGARLEAEVVGEDAAGVAIDLESVRLAAAAVEGEHLLLEESLAIGVLARERLELRNDGVVTAAGELRVVPELERRQP